MNECIACGLDFLSVETFEDHRVGPHGYCYIHNPGATSRDHVGDVDERACRWRAHPERRCLTPAEMAQKGLQTDQKGRWGTPEGIRHRLELSSRLALVRQAKRPPGKPNRDKEEELAKVRRDHSGGRRSN